MLLYEMIHGLPPFYDGMSSWMAHVLQLTELFSENTDRMYEKILNKALEFGEEFSDEAVSILTGLLNRDPSQRLGVRGADDIKRHPFFTNHIDFALLAQKRIRPPFKPSVVSPVDVSNFDTVFTEEAPIDSYVENSNLSSTVQAQFSGTFGCYSLFSDTRLITFIRFLLQWYQLALHYSLNALLGTRYPIIITFTHLCSLSMQSILHSDPIYITYSPYQSTSQQLPRPCCLKL